VGDGEIAWGWGKISPHFPLGSANLGLFLGYKKLCGGDFRGGRLSQISTLSLSVNVKQGWCLVPLPRGRGRGQWMG